MKILITGQNSYIGNNLYTWLQKNNNNYVVSKQSVRNGAWKEIDFSQFDTIVHVAGLAHVTTNTKDRIRYYRINRDLTYEIAEKAKSEKVRHFIFLSSIIVYGDGKEDNYMITKDTEIVPSNFYGDSKIQAEKLIKELEGEDFRIAIIRPPMVYGKNSKGNYPKLSKLAKLFPIFPDYNNQRSMIHIDNLTEFIKLIIDNQDEGLFFPQNKEYVSTKELFRLIRKSNGKKTYMTKLFNPIIRMLISKVTLVNKVFGSLTYDKSLSKYKENYCVNTFEESIELTER